MDDVKAVVRAAQEQREARKEREKKAKMAAWRRRRWRTDPSSKLGS